MQTVSRCHGAHTPADTHASHEHSRSWQLSSDDDDDDSDARRRRMLTSAGVVVVVDVVDGSSHRVQCVMCALTRSHTPSTVRHTALLPSAASAHTVRIATRLRPSCKVFQQRAAVISIALYVDDGSCSASRVRVFDFGTPTAAAAGFDQSSQRHLRARQVFSNFEHARTTICENR